MGRNSGNYASYLRTLVKSLGLTSQVVWNGYVSKERPITNWRTQGICSSARACIRTRDFGLAALMFLLHGGRAVLSAWGGHLDLKRNFRSSTVLVPVRSSTAGPFLNPHDPQPVLEAELKKPATRSVQRRPHGPYSLEQVRKLILAMLNGPELKPKPLRPSAHMRS